MTLIRSRAFSTATVLAATASTLALAAPAAANEALFTTGNAAPEIGQRVEQVQGLTQIRLAKGGIASFIDAADYRINADGSIDLYAGSVTVAGNDDGEIVVRMPEGLEGRVWGRGSAGSFTVEGDGTARGHALTGTIRIGRGGNFRDFSAGEMFLADRGARARQVVSNGAQATPTGTPSDDSGQVFAMGGDAGPVNAAQNGLPVTLGDALAAAGASADILGAARRVEAAAANPLIETFPTGDLALLVQTALRLEGAFGGQPFGGAQADIIRTYLAFLASGGSGADFLTAYSGFLTQYFDLIRSGAAPSGFGLVGLGDIDAFVGFLSRTQGFGALAARDRALADAYLAFIAGGGDRDRFLGTFTDLTDAYFAFLRAGGNPQDFTGASIATVEQYLAFLNASGLSAQLSAANRALLSAYLANGGAAFIGQYQAALNAYFDFLRSGRRPSEYTGADISVLLGYVQTLQAAGLAEQVLGANAQFFIDYAAFVQGGGQVDAFGQLNANVFTQYAQALDAYFAFLDAGGLPSAYTAADVAVLNSFLQQLAAAGALDRFLGDRSAFFADYLAFLQGGGAIDTYAALNANIFAAYAQALTDYYQFLENGGIPSGYTALSQETIAAYLAALSRVGASDVFLANLAQFYADYFAFIQAGNDPDNFAGLPVPPDFPAFAAALNAYAAFLQGGGLPANYTAEQLATLQRYLSAVVNSGQLAALLGSNADLLTGYFTYFATGGAPNGFNGLPVYATYVSALNAYYDFLLNGGVPSDYAVLSAATIQAYLDALNAAGGFAAYVDLNAFFVDYYVFIAGGGNPDQFAGLPGGGGTGGGGTDQPSPQLGDVRGWQFARDGLRVARVDADVTEEGRITSLTVYNPSGVTTDYSDRTADLREFGRFGDAVAWTRYYVGTANRQQNVSEHLMVGTPAFDIPTTGTVAYALVGGTAPTNRNAAPGSTAYFTGELAVAFGSAARVGFNFDLYTEGTGYRVQTNGGAAGAATGGLYAGNDGLFESQSLGLEVISGTGCTGYCIGQVFGGLFGDGASHAGFTYNVFDRNANNAVQGVAIFGQQGDTIAGLGDAGQLPGTGGGGGGQAPVLGTDFDGTFANDGVGSRQYWSGSFYRSARRDYIGYTGNAAERDGDIGIDANGVTRFAGGVTRTANTVVAETYGNERLLIGRWEDEYDQSNLRDNMSMHYLLMAPLSEPLALPGGKVDYRLLASTKPTSLNGYHAPGVLDANLSIAFGSTPKVGIEGTITMPETGGNAGYVYTFATPNGVANPSNTIGIGDNGTIAFIAQGTGDNDTAGAINFEGGLGDSQASILGLTYMGYMYRNSNRVFYDALHGAALFGDKAVYGADGGVGGGGNGGGINTTREGIRFYGLRDARTPTEANGTAVITDGKLAGFNAGPSFIVQPMSAEVVEGGVTDAVAWGRWTGGRVQIARSTDEFTNNRSFHTFAGAPITNRPSNTTVQYELIGGTSPTDNQGSAPGSFSGDMAVQFGTGSNIRVGVELTMDVGGKSWTAATNGGVANPGQSQISSTNFVNDIDVIASSANACLDSCSVKFNGALFGNAAATAAVGMQVSDNSGGTFTEALGVAIFGAETAAPAASIAPTAMAMANLPVAIPQTDWSRWSAPARQPGAAQLPVIAADPSTMRSEGGLSARPLGDWISFDTTDRR